MAENDEIISYIKRAFELREQECYKQAIEMLYKAISIEPDNIEIMFQLGELYYLLGNYPRAIQYPEQILEQDENHLPSLKLLKNIFIKQNELFSAKETIEKIYSLEPEVQNLISLIEIYGKLELLSDLDKYKPEIEKSDKCLLEYAKSVFENSDLQKAEEIVDNILQNNPENEDGEILKGKILFQKNETEKAKEIFNKYGSHTENPEILNFKGLFLLDELDYVEAIKAFSKASSLDKKNSIYKFNLGNAYFLNGWIEEAETAYKNAICLEPQNQDYRYSLAYLYYEQGDFAKAQNEIESILSNNNKHAGANVIKALLLYRNKNYIEAEKRLSFNLNNGNADSFTLSSLAKIELELGKYEAAKKHLQSALDYEPDNLDYKCGLAKLYLKDGNPPKAMALTKEIIEQNVNYIEGYILGAEAAFSSGDYNEAKNFAQAALSIDINCSKGYYYLALVRAQEADYEEAIECLRRAILYDVSNPDYYVKIAEIYKLSGDIKTAFEYIKEAESIDNSEKYKILFKEYAKLNRK